MAAAPPSHPPPLGQPPQPTSDGVSSGLSWEGDKMFNIYIYDYCHKRGFKKTARELLAEADIAPDSTPPINARQGLLFEWWSVFWVLFQAKSNPLGGSTEDALTYTQHQARQAAIRLQNTQSSAPPPSGPPLHLAAASSGGMPHRINGLPQPQRPGSFLPNGSLPNGAAPPGMPGPPFTQPNGTSNPVNQHPLPPQQGAAFVPGAVPRPQINGPPPPPGQLQQVRGAGSGPFQSPTMAHSPPGSGAPPPQQSNQFGVPVGASPHMGHMVMGRNMMPHSPMNPNTQGNTPQPGQQPMQGHNQFAGGRPPSRTTTPADVHPSPSLTQRQVTGDIINMEVLNIPNATLEVLKGELGLAGKDVSALTSNDKQRILSAFRARRPSIPKPGESMGPGPSNLMRPNLQPTPNMQNRNNKRNSNSPGDEHEHLRTESSPPDRKRARTSPGQTPSMTPMYPGQQQPGPSGMQHPGMQTGAGGMHGGMPGPGGMQGPNPSMSGPMQPGGMQSGTSLGMPPGMQSHGPAGLSAPGAPNMMPQGPMSQPGGMPPGAAGMQQGPPGGGPGPGMQPHMGGPTNMMMPGRMPNGALHSGGQMGMNPQMGGMPQMNHQMGPPGVPSNMTAYRQNMANMHKNNMPINSASPSDSPFNAGMGPQFNPNPGSRPMNNPAVGGQPQHRMHLPASPAPGKDGNKDGKPTNGSPRNQQVPNQGPTTPVPNHQNATSNQGTPVGGPRTAPSPVPIAVMGSLNPMNQTGGMHMGMGGMMGMNQPPPPNSGMAGGSGAGGNNAAPGTGGGGAPGGAGGPGPGGGVGGGGTAGGATAGVGSGMSFLGMNPMAGMNGPVGTGLSGMNPLNSSSSSTGNNGDTGAGGAGGMGGMQDLVFSHEFMQSVANTLVDDLDPTMVFRPDGDIDFERDFRQWFHPEDSLDLK